MYTKVKNKKMYVCICIYMYIGIYMPIYTYIYAYIFMYTRVMFREMNYCSLKDFTVCSRMGGLSRVS